MLSLTLDALSPCSPSGPRENEFFYSEALLEGFLEILRKSYVVLRIVLETGVRMNYRGKHLLSFTLFFLLKNGCHYEAKRVGHSTRLFMEINLLGEEVKEEKIGLKANGKPRRKPTVANGYYSTPGSGPKGETCGSCKFAVGRKYKKCELAKEIWTHGTGSDIRLKSPACHKWQAK
jgi:hypothetical protein